MYMLSRVTYGSSYLVCVKPQLIQPEFIQGDSNVNKELVVNFQEVLIWHIGFVRMKHFSFFSLSL